MPLGKRNPTCGVVLLKWSVTTAVPGVEVVASAPVAQVPDGWGGRGRTG
ncbi:MULTISPECIES: hypothetical protein [unclassified Streptomyces]|nr:hypothetical protein [Streptomyces sp. NBC_00223]